MYIEEETTVLALRSRLKNMLMIHALEEIVGEPWDQFWDKAVEAVPVDLKAQNAGLTTQNAVSPSTGARIRAK